MLELKQNEDSLLIATASGNGRSIPYVVHGGTALCLCYRAVDDAVLLVRQERPVIGRETIEAPSGLVEPGESPMDAGARELREETGYEARTLRELGSVLSSVGMTNERIFLFWADDLSPVVDPSELDAEWFPRMDAVDNILNAGGDGKTLVAILLLTRVLELGFRTEIGPSGTVP